MYFKWSIVLICVSKTKGSPSSDESASTNLTQIETEKQEAATTEIPGVLYKVKSLSQYQHMISPCSVNAFASR